MWNHRMEGHMISMNGSYLFVIISTSMKTSLCQVPIGENKKCKANSYMSNLIFVPALYI